MDAHVEPYVSEEDACIQKHFLLRFWQALNAFNASQVTWDKYIVGMIYALNLPLALKILSQPELLTPFLIAHFTTPGLYFLLFFAVSSVWRERYARSRQVATIAIGKFQH